MKKEGSGEEKMGFKLKKTLMAILSLAVQKSIIAKIESEQALMFPNRELAKRMEKDSTCHWASVGAGCLRFAAAHLCR